MHRRPQSRQGRRNILSSLKGTRCSPDAKFPALKRWAIIGGGDPEAAGYSLSGDVKAHCLKLFALSRQSVWRLLTIAQPFKAGMKCIEGPSPGRDGRSILSSLNGTRCSPDARFPALKRWAIIGGGRQRRRRLFAFGIRQSALLEAVWTVPPICLETFDNSPVL